MDSVKCPSTKIAQPRGNYSGRSASADGVRKRDSQIVEATTPGIIRSPVMHEEFRMLY